MSNIPNGDALYGQGVFFSRPQHILLEQNMYTNNRFCKYFTGKDKWPVSYFWLGFHVSFNTTLKAEQQELDQAFSF